MARPSPEEFLRTDHVEADLARRSVRGGALAISTQAARFLLNVASTMALARMLEARDFGVIAVAVASVGVLSLVKDAGLTSATIQHRSVSHRQASTLFWATAGLSTLVSLVIAVLAPLLGWFYGDTRVRDVVLAMAVVPLVDGLGMQHLAIMIRRMEFPRISAVDVISMLVALATAVAVAWRGGGYWALVAQEIAGSFVSTALLWILCGWRPGPPSRTAGVGKMVRFGLNQTGVRVFSHLTNNLDTVVVGRFAGVRRAGVYDRAFRVLTLPFQLVTGPFGSVVVPALSRLQGDPERYRAFYRRWIRLIYALSMPLVVFLFVDAKPAVIAVLGARWAPMVPIYRALAPAAFFGRTSFLIGWIYTSTGRPDRHLRWVAAAFVPMLVGYLVGVRWGAYGVAVAHSLVSVLLWYPALAHCCRTAPVTPRDVVEQMLRPAILSIAAGVVLHLLVRDVLPRVRPLTLGLALHAALYGALYLGLWIATPAGRREVGELLGQIRSMRAGEAAPPTEQVSGAVATTAETDRPG